MKEEDCDPRMEIEGGGEICRGRESIPASFPPPSVCVLSPSTLLMGWLLLPGAMFTSFIDMMAVGGFSTCRENVVEFLGRLDDGCDVVVGYDNRVGGEMGYAKPLSRMEIIDNRGA